MSIPQTNIDLNKLMEALNDKVDKDSYYGFPTGQYLDISTSGQMANLFLPVRKGQTVIVRGSADGADFIARFIYASN